MLVSITIKFFLNQQGIQTQKHDGVRTQFGLTFIKTGQLPRAHGKLFTKLFDFRQKGDYGDIFDFDEQTVKPLIDQVRLFLDEARRLIG